MADLNIDRNVVVVPVQNADADQAVGTVLATYTCPAGKQARLIQHIQTFVAGSASIRAVWRRPSVPTTVELKFSGVSTTALILGFVHLEAGDIYEAQVHIQGAGALWDLLLSFEEFSAKRNN